LQHKTQAAHPISDMALGLRAATLTALILPFADRLLARASIPKETAMKFSAERDAGA
jgi:hypothetical protein